MLLVVGCHFGEIEVHHHDEEFGNDVDRVAEVFEISLFKLQVHRPDEGEHCFQTLLELLNRMLTVQSKL